MEKVSCIYCHKKSKVILRGKRKNKYVIKQQYWCKRCKKYFTERCGFEGVTYPSDVIIKTLRLYAEGKSLSRIRDYIYQHKGCYIYDGTILYWAGKYSDILSQTERAANPLVKRAKKISTLQVILK